MAARWTSSSSTSAKNEKFQHTKLDESKDSLSLLSILRAFDGPVTEERAWAILYQSAKTGLQCFNSANPPPPPPTTSRHNNNNQQQSHQQHANNNIHNLTDKSENEVMKCVVVGETSHLWIHRDGHVHPHSFQEAADSIEAERRTVAECQSQLVSGLGWALYEALDYGCKQNEQNILSPDLEQMIDFLTSADEGECQSAEAEGIEQDSGEAEDSAAAAAAASVSSTSTTSSSSASPAAATAAASAMKTLSHVMDRCCPHISSTALSKQADFVSRTNCRKLVYDTLRLPVKTSSATPDVFRKPKSKTQPNEQYASNQATSYVKESPRGRKPYERPPLRMLEKKGTLQEQLDEERRHKEEERRLKEKTERELADIKRSHQSLEQKLKAARRKIEEDAEQFQRKDIEFELRLHQMQEELAEREARLNVQERQIAEFQEQERVRRRHVGQLTSQSRLPVAVRATAAGPAIARFVTPAPHVAIPQTNQPSVQPRLALAVVRATIGPTAPPPPVRPSTVRGISNRSTEPTVAHPLPTAPPMHRCHGGSGNSFQRIRLIKRRYY